MHIRTINMIHCADWDEEVKATYKRPYCFQQQDGCQSRGVRFLTVPALTISILVGKDEFPDTVPEEVNHPQMGVNFCSWRTRDPTEPLSGDESNFALKLWWERNFYPPLQDVANDLYDRGILPAGEYGINIDW